MSEKLQETQTEQRPLTLLIEIDGKEKRFVTPKKIKGTMWRHAALVAEEIESKQVLIADLDSHLQFVCDIFGNQFDIGQLEDGIDARDIMKTIYATTLFVMGQVSIASEMLMRSVDLADLGEIDEKKS